MNKKQKIVLGTAGAFALTLITSGSALVLAQSNTKGQALLDKVAAKVGVDSQKLKDSFKEVSKEEVDQKVQDGKLTQEQADKIKAKIDTEEFPGIRFEGPGGRHGGFMKPGLDGLETFLGLTEDQLMTKMKAGEKLIDIAKAQGKSEEDLKNYLGTKMDERLAADVKEGRLTQAEADKMKENREDMITKILSGERPEKPMRDMGRMMR
jgi:hypothetical protein